MHKMDSARTPTPTAEKLTNRPSGMSLHHLATASHVRLRLAFFSLLLVSMARPARAQTESVLYSFTGGADGGYPGASLIQDSQGNLYGVTPGGGAYGWGTVFSLSPSGTITVLHSFTGGKDGASPQASLIQDVQGNLYGTTCRGAAYDAGTVFKMSPSGAVKALYTFTGGVDGGGSCAALIQDAQGNLYSTTSFGGAYNSGTAFVLDKGARETVLYSFTGGGDGGYPGTSLLQDAQGYLRGTTPEGGAYANGTVFMVTPKGSERVLYSFTGGLDGAQPEASLIQDAQGLLYGTTYGGGAYGCGTVFMVSPSGAEKVLYNFTGGPDGGSPWASLVQDAKGNLYGTTITGGAYGYGTVFRVTPGGGEKVLYSFAGGVDGRNPAASLIRDAKGNLYGTTVYGGAYGYGTVFMLVP